MRVNLKFIVVYRKANLMAKVVNLSPAPGLPAVYGTIEDLANEAAEANQEQPAEVESISVSVSDKWRKENARKSKELTRRYKKLSKREADKKKRVRKAREASDPHKIVLKILGRSGLKELRDVYYLLHRMDSQTTVLPVVNIPKNFATVGYRNTKKDEPDSLHTGLMLSFDCHEYWMLLASLVAPEVILAVAESNKKKRMNLARHVLRISKPSSAYLKDVRVMATDFMIHWIGEDGPSRLVAHMSKKIAKQASKKAAKAKKKEAKK